MAVPTQTGAWRLTAAPRLFLADRYLLDVAFVAHTGSGELVTASNTVRLVLDGTSVQFNRRGSPGSAGGYALRTGASPGNNGVEAQNASDLPNVNLIILNTVDAASANQSATITGLTAGACIGWTPSLTGPVPSCDSDPEAVGIVLSTPIVNLQPDILPDAPEVVLFTPDVVAAPIPEHEALTIFLGVPRPVPDLYHTFRAEAVLSAFVDINPDIRPDTPDIRLFIPEGAAPDTVGISVSTPLVSVLTAEPDTVEADVAVIDPAPVIDIAPDSVTVGSIAASPQPAPVVAPLPVGLALVSPDVDASPLDDWPDEVPHEFLLQGFRRTIGGNALPFQPDAGRPMLRRRYTRQPTTISGTIVMTNEQWAAFRTFYFDTLDAGARQFRMPDPMDPGGTIAASFLSAPVRTPRGSDWQVELNIRVEA